MNTENQPMFRLPEDQTMKVSFVVPIYKKPRKIVKRCINSLLYQAYKNNEVICVFDGSDKDLENLVEDFEKDSNKEGQEPRVKHIVIEHGGASRARNEGFKHVIGDIVSFWDSDCYAEPGMSLVWVNKFKKNPDLDFMYSSYKFVQQEVPGFISESFNPWLLERYNYIASMFPIRREKFPGWDEKLDGLQDWDYWRRAVKNGCKGEFHEGFAFMTEYPDKDSISGSGDFTERIKAVRKKHGDPERDTLVWGYTMRSEAEKFAYLIYSHLFNIPPIVFP